MDLNADNMEKSDDSDYELGFAFEERSLPQGRRRKKKDGLRCNECLNSQKPYDPEEGSKVSNLYQNFFRCKSLFIYFSNNEIASLLKHFLCHCIFRTLLQWKTWRRFISSGCPQMEK